MENEALVRALLSEAGLPASEEEIQTLVLDYPRLKSGIEAMYSLEATRYETPALMFQAAPELADWA